MTRSTTRPLLFAVALAAILLLGFWLRVWRLDAQSLWYDEAVSAQVAQQGIGELARWTADDIQPPLYYLVLAGWTQAAGLSETALRLPSAFLGVLMVALAFVLGRRLFGQAAGLLAALLAAVHPLWVYYSQEARMYTLLSALGMLAGYALLRVLAASNRQNGYPKKRLLWWIGFALAAIALLYTHYFAAFLLLAFAVYFLIVILVHGGPQRPRLLLEGAVVAVLIGLAYLPWLPNVLRRFRVDASYWQGALKLDEALRHVAISFSAGETVLEGQATWLALAVIALAGVCLIALVWAAGRSRAGERVSGRAGDTSEVGVRWASVLFVVLYLLVPVVAILALAYRTPKFNPRYLMLASPAFLLLLAGGLALPFSAAAGSHSKLWQRIGAGAAIAGMLLVSLYAVRNWFFDPAFTKDDWRGAAAYVRANIQPDEAVVLVSGHALPAWRYYAPDLEPVRLPEIEILDVNAVLNGQDAAGALHEQLAGKAGAWLVEWQEEVVDPSGVARFWLDEVGDLQSTQPSFWGLDQVRHYRIEPGTALPDDLVPDTPLKANFAGQVALLGFSQPACQPTVDGLPCPVYLFWQALQPLTSDLKLSATLIDSYGGVWSPSLEQRLSAYEYPTFRWPPGATVLSRLDVKPFPGTPPGDYDLRLGVYFQDAETGTAQSLDLRDDAGAAAGRWTLVPFAQDQLTPSEPPEPMQPAVAAAPAIDLIQASGRAAAVAPGEQLQVDLWWLAASQPDEDYEIRWEWQDAAGTPAAWGTRPLAGAEFPTSRWQPDAAVHSQLLVPAPLDAQPGQWRLRVGLSRAGDPAQFAGDSLALPVEILAARHEFDAPPVQFPSGATVADQIVLVGVSTASEPVQAGSQVPVTVVWRASGPAPVSYTAFVHLLDDGGRVAAQDDHLPLSGQRPTDTWLADEVIVDQHVLSLPADLPPGRYRLEIGLYDANRPDLARPGEAVVLGSIEVEEVGKTGP